MPLHCHGLPLERMGPDLILLDGRLPDASG
jgi:hypothetical protein